MISPSSEFGGVGLLKLVAAPCCSRGTFKLPKNEKRPAPPEDAPVVPALAPAPVLPRLPTPPDDDEPKPPDVELYPPLVVEVEVELHPAGVIGEPTPLGK